MATSESVREGINGFVRDDLLTVRLFGQDSLEQSSSDARSYRYMERGSGVSYFENVRLLHGYSTE
jgi:hypothetical protein